MQNTQWKLFQCSIQTDYQHIVENPIGLSCGHTICKQCIPQNDTEDLLIECSLCGKVNKNDLLNAEVLSAVKELIDVKCNDLFKLIEIRFKESYERLKQTKIPFDELLNLKFEFAREEIHVRIESLKSELDQMEELMNKKLKNIRDQFMNQNLIPKLKFVDLEKVFNELKRYMFRTTRKSSEKLYEYQRKIKFMNDCEKTCEKANAYFELSFDPSDFKFNPSLIGKITSIYNDDPAEKNLRTDVMNFIHELTSELEEKQSQIDEQNEMIEQLNLKNEELLSELEKLRLIDDLNDEINTKNETIDHLKDENDKFSDELEKVNHRLYKHINEIKALSEERDLANQNLFTIQQNFDSLTNENQHLQSKILSLNKEIDYHFNEKDKLNSIIQKLNDEIKSMSNDRTELLNEIDKKTQEISGLRAVLSSNLINTRYTLGNSFNF